jgi:hypothetical protein
LLPLLGRFAIIVLTEISFRHEGENYVLEGYDSFYRSRINKRGGGLALFINNTYKFSEAKTNYVNFEGISGTVYFDNGMSIVLLAIYRPPICNKALFVDELNVILEQSNDVNMVLIGDTNIDLLQEEDNVVQMYKTVLSANGFLACIVDVTREEHRQESLSKSCLDHIFIRFPVRSNYQFRSVIYTTKLTDHYMIGVNIEVNTNNPAEGVKDAVSERLLYNEKKLSRLLREISWGDLLTETNCNSLYNKLEMNFMKCYNLSKFVPLNTCRRKKRICKNWISEELKELIRERDIKFKLWKNCKNSLSKILRDDYKKFRNHVNKQINTAKCNYYKEKICKSNRNSKETWQVINEIIGKTKRASVDEVIFKYIGQSESLDAVTNSFANSFVNDVSDIIHKCDLRASSTEINQEIQSMRMPKVHAELVKTLIDKLDIKKQTGNDRIRVCDLKLLKHEISPVLAHMINLSLANSIFPTKLKISVVKPIYKKGDHMEYKNYRPVAILPGIEQIEERCVAIILHDYLHKHNIINTYQFGFQKNRSTSDLLQLFSDFVNSNLNDNKHVLGLFIDFSKAFDTLNHSKLLYALESIGIRGPMLQWFGNYLEDRRFLVRIGNECSIMKQVQSGVPQGSILGPVLYLIYVNNMFNCIQNCKVFMYADDTVILAAHKKLNNAEIYLQEDFNRLVNWTHDHDLVINSDKTKIIHFASPFNKDLDTQSSIVCHSYACIHNSINGISLCSKCSIIETVPTHTYLGMIVDRFLCWNPHIVKISNRLRSASFQIYQLKNILPFNTLKLVYHALVESVLLYGILSYGNASNNHLRHITVIQNKIIRTLAPKFDSKSQSYQHCKLLPFQELFLYRFILKYYYCDDHKIINQHNVNTRQQLKVNYVVPTYINKYGKRQLSVSIPSIFNNIPEHVRNIGSFSLLKEILKSHLLENTNLQ